jgi:hypothetical protein
MDTNLPPIIGEHTAQLGERKKAKSHLDTLLEGSIGKPEKKMSEGKDSLQITYEIPEGLQYPYTNTFTVNLVDQYKDTLGVRDGISPGEIEKSSDKSTVTITLTGAAFDKMVALQKLAEKQPSGRTP